MTFLSIYRSNRIESNRIESNLILSYLIYLSIYILYMIHIYIIFNVIIHNSNPSTFIHFLALHTHHHTLGLPTSCVSDVPTESNKVGLYQKGTIQVTHLSSVQKPRHSMKYLLVKNGIPRKNCDNQ